MCCVSREVLAVEPYLADFKPVVNSLSMKEVATVLEVFEFAMSEVSSSYIINVLENSKGNFLFLLSNEEGEFDLYDFLNKHYNSDVVINCINAKKMFSRGMSNGIFVGEDVGTDEMENEDDCATGYMDEDELEGLLQTCNLTLRWCRSGVNVPVSTSKLSVGRSAKKCGFVILGNTNVSREHCEVFTRGSDLIIVDKSNNGTYRNGSRLVKGAETKLNEGDVVMLADERLEVVNL